jgi:hypothetical protein
MVAVGSTRGVCCCYGSAAVRPILIHGACRANTSDQFYGIRACIGGSPLDWFETEPWVSTGSVAFMDAFGRINPTEPGSEASVQRDVFVFSE